jgi:hypothetical protein
LKSTFRSFDFLGAAGLLDSEKEDNYFKDLKFDISTCISIKWKGL